MISWTTFQSEALADGEYDEQVDQLLDEKAMTETGTHDSCVDSNCTDAIESAP